MNRKLASLITILALCFSLASCGSATKEESAATVSFTAVSSAVNSVQAEEAEPVADEKKEEKAEDNPQLPEGEGELGSYYVSIKGARKSTDYEGNPVIIITYEWTNNSDDTTSPAGSMMEQAFQNGVQMEVGIVTEEINDSFTQVRPGTTIKVDAVYSLTSDSTVEFEISALEDMFQSPTPKVAMNFEPSSLD